MKINLAPNEKLIREGCANLRRGIETVGGRLFLTDSRPVFLPHAFNVQTGTADVPLTAIRSVTPCWTKFLGVIPLAANSLAVRTHESEYRVVVSGRAGWAQSIQTAMAKLGA